MQTITRNGVAAAVLGCLLGVAGQLAAQTQPVSGGTIEFRFTPAARVQLALWVEVPGETSMKLIRLTQSVSYWGIGNRPGASQMNSGFRWPYGRREGVLPVWAHRRVALGGIPFNRVIFQDRESEGFASRTSNDSSPDSYFCLSFMQAKTPDLRRKESLDAVTCASGFMSDKGRFLQSNETAYAEPSEANGMGLMRVLGLTSLYPPRRDVKPCLQSNCAADASDPSQRFDQHARELMPEIDAVTMATPPGESEQSILFTIPAEWPSGMYTAWLEVNTEGDYNSTFNDSTVPTPTTPESKWDSWAIQSGYAYRGQPSVVYRVPFLVGQSNVATAVKPEFYGDVNGFGDQGGQMRPMDSKITDDPAGAPGSGSDRLRLVAAHDYRFRVSVQGLESCGSHQAPGKPANVVAEPVDDHKNSHQWGHLAFDVPSSAVPIVHYEVRVSSATMDETVPSTFERALPAVAASLDSEALSLPTSGLEGSRITGSFGGMQPVTTYYVGVRAIDACNVSGPYAVTALTTTKINFTKLSGCFIATAAFGSEWEPQVDALRQARDDLRRKSTLFTIATDLYYRSGPAAAAVIARSDLARAVVRSVLAPVVTLAQAAYPDAPRSAVP